MKKRFIGVVLALEMLVAAFNVVPAQAAESINDTVAAWGIQEKINTQDLTEWLTNKGENGSCCMNVNKDYGFVYTTHFNSGADHFIYLKNKTNTYTGDFSVEFDLFLNDIDYIDIVEKSKTEASAIRVGVGYDGADGKLVKNYYQNFYGNVSTGTLSDDNGTLHNIYKATARKKYGLDTITGTDYLNVRFVIKNNKFYQNVKWNGANNWIQLRSGNLTAACSNYIYLQCGPQVGIDNLKIYRPKSEIVRIPKTYSYYDLVDEDAENMIVTPHFGTPTFTEPGSTMNVEFTNNTSVDFSKGTFDVYLENEYKSWYANSSAPTAGNIYLGTKGGYNITVTVPEDISPELMNLYMVHKNENDVIDAEYFAPKSVQVTEELNQNFYSVAISDTHIDKWGGPEYEGKNARVLQFFNKALSIGGARYLSHTGDINDNKSKDRATSIKETFVRAFEDSTVPMIVAAGNHEYDTYTYPNASEVTDAKRTQLTYAEYKAGEFSDNDVQIYNTFNENTFDEFFGTKTALISMGENMVIAKHDFGAWTKLTGEDSIFIKLRDALANAWDKSDADYRIIYQHSENTGKANNAKETYGTAAFMSPAYHSEYLAKNPKQYDIQYTGHYHETYVRGEKILTLGGLGKSSASWQGSGVISDFTYNNGSWTNSADAVIDNYGVLNEDGWGSYDESVVDEIQTDFIDNFNLMTTAIEDTYYNPNDGTADFNIATVKNIIDFNFYDGRIYFVMKPGNYKVSGGELLSQYNSYDNGKTIVVAKVNIPKGSKGNPASVNVTCSPVDETNVPVKFVLSGAETGFVSANVKYLDIVSNTDIDTDTFTNNNIAVESNGFQAEYSISYPDAKTARIHFINKLEENSKYTVTLNDRVLAVGDMLNTKKTFVFTVLPDKGIEFIKETITVKSSSGYRTSKDMKVLIDGVEKGISDMQYENYVLDYTLSLPGYGNDIGVLETVAISEAKGRLDWFINTTNSEGSLVTIRPRSYETVIDGGRTRVHIDGLGWFNFADTMISNPVRLQTENAYDFRIVKLGNKWTAYAKNINSDRYDILFSFSGDEKKIYSGVGYTDIYTSLPGSHTYWYNYILYPIQNVISAPKIVGNQFDVAFDIQPENLESIVVDGLGDVEFEKLSTKTYKVTMPDSWTKKSNNINLSFAGIEDIYGNAINSISVAPEEYEVSFDEIKLIQNGEYVKGVSAGEFSVEIIVKQNWALPENANLICAVYKDENCLEEVKLIAPENISYNGTTVRFDVKSTVDAPEIKIFALDTDAMLPLAKNIN